MKQQHREALFTLFVMAAMSGCYQNSSSDDRVVVSEAVEGEVVWEDLSIQKLLPGFMMRPAVEPYLPKNFVAMSPPGAGALLYWGEKEAIEAYFADDNSSMKSAIISINISFNVAQIDEDHFSDEGFESGMIEEGFKNLVINKRKWGAHPVMSMTATVEGKEVRTAWIGLNTDGQVLLANLLYPSNQAGPSEDDLKMWSDFLTKTKGLDQHAFFKAHGQDLREGLTLVNVYGSVLKVSAEKRMRDGQIQMRIEPADETITCRCLNVEQLLMEAPWHFLEPIVKMEAQIQVKSDANIMLDQTITVLLKTVNEFSPNIGGVNLDKVSNPRLGRIMVLNFAGPKLMEQPGYQLDMIQF